MRIGASLFLIAIGAILAFAVTGHVSGINLHVVGVILIVIGLVGLAIDLVLWGNRRRATVVTHTPTVTYVDPADPMDPVDRY
jgi:hypothetical protein